MKKNGSLVEGFTDTNKEMCKDWIAVEPKDVYLAYCALALCTIADKMTDSSGPLFDPDKAKEFLRDNPGKEKDAEIESGKTKL